MNPASRLIGRVTRLPPPVTTRVRVQRDLEVRLRDGVVLKADRYIPDGIERAPVVLIRSPYGRRGVVGSMFYGQPIAARGFQVVLQSCRGTAGSGGILDPFNERDDGLDTLAWLREQPWYAGRLAMLGPSYLGLTQWAIADAAGADLRAMVPMVAASQLAGETQRGGVFSLETTLGWTVLMAAAGSKGVTVRGALLSGRKARPAFTHLPMREMDRVATGATVPFWQEWLDHPDPDDPYWKQRDYRDNVPGAKAPVALVGAWYDIFLPWQLADYAALRAAGVHPRLVIGPWTHRSTPIAGGLREAVAWLRAHLAGDASGVEGGPVRIYVTGARQWRDYPDWPISGISTQTWYLQPGGGLALRPADRGPPTRYRYDPVDPTPSLGGPQLEGRARVRQDKLESRADVVTFTSPLLPNPVEAIGPVRATVYLRSTVEHTDLFVRLCEVDRRGRSRHVCDGIQRITPDNAERDSEGVLRVDVELWPTAHRFRQGHCIRLQVSSGAHPRFIRNPGTGDPLATASRLVAAGQEVFHDVRYPSHVALPIAPTW